MNTGLGTDSGAERQKDSPTPGARPWVLFYLVMSLSARVERGLQGAAPRIARA